MICSREKRILVPGVGPTIIISLSQFKDVSELQSLSSHSPIVKVEQVKIVFCWFHILHTLPTSTMSMSRSVQWECPLQLFSSWCSISVVLIRVLPLEQPLSSQPAFFFLTLPSWRILSPRARQAGCWHGGHAEILCASGPCWISWWSNGDLFQRSWVRFPSRSETFLRPWAEEVPDPVNQRRYIL